MKALVHVHDTESKDYLGQFEIHAWIVSDLTVPGFVKNKMSDELRTQLFESGKETGIEFDGKKFKIEIESRYSSVDRLTQIISIHATYIDYLQSTWWEFKRSYTVIKIKD